MGRINILDTLTANAIKAGEVIERPVSVVKELVDNSIDAGATSIKIEFENGGISLIRVSDNGIGMDPEDAHKAFLIHATSKIKSVEDIYDLSTQGFRGEALASIVACSNVTLITKQADQDTGTLIKYVDGKLVTDGETAADNGTVITVTDLFARIPARYKFLKKDSTEGMYISSLVEKLAIINSEISFKLIKDGKTILSTPGSGDMKDAIYSIYGKQITSGLIEVNYEYEGTRLTGYTGDTKTVRGNRAMQYLFVNNRAIRNTSVSAAIDEAYRNSVMKNRFPICFLAVYVPADKVDVNVHPQKAEVKFSSETDIFRLVYHGLKNALSSNTIEFPDAADIITELKETSNSPERIQIHMDHVSAEPAGKLRGAVTYNDQPTKKEADAANDLLKILSEFKPDIEEISGNAPSEVKAEPSLENVSENDADVPVVSDVPATEDTVPEEEPVREITGEIALLKKARFVGFLFNTYIILQGEDDFFLVDQHAAHERVLYERFMAKKITRDNEKRDVQTLLVPQIVDLSTADYSFVSDNLDQFEANGFDIEILGDRQVALRAIPVADRAEDRLKSMSKPSVFFQMILNDLKKETPEKGSIWYSLIQTTACKAAIKAHDVITEEEAMSLIDQLVVLDDPYHCAHGRPTYIRTSLTDLEKRFKRIV